MPEYWRRLPCAPNLRRDTPICLQMRGYEPNIPEKPGGAGKMDVAVVESGHPECAVQVDDTRVRLPQRQHPGVAADANDSMSCDRYCPGLRQGRAHSPDEPLGKMRSAFPTPGCGDAVSGLIDMNTAEPAMARRIFVAIKRRKIRLVSSPDKFRLRPQPVARRSRCMAVA